MKTTQCGLPGLVTIAIAELMAASGFAAEAQDSLEEVIVTAQRRAENLQTVPISVSAIQGAELERLQISTTSELSEFTPSLHIYAETVGSEFYTIRGIGRTSEDLSADPGVAVFINE